MTDQPQLISMNQACELTSLSRTSINRLRAANDFPKAVQVSDTKIAFVRSEVHAWVNERIRRRRTDYARKRKAAA